MRQSKGPLRSLRAGGLLDGLGTLNRLGQLGDGGRALLEALPGPGQEALRLGVVEAAEHEVSLAGHLAESR